jgi:fibronectin-binding autotransporter adhesin
VANITLTVDSNWSTCSNGTNTGSAPGSTDNIYLNGHALNMDGANSSTYTCTSISATTNGSTPSAGTITLANAVSTITASITAGTGTLLTVGTSKTLTINGTVTAGSSSGASGILMSATTSNVTVTTTVGSATQSNAYGLYVNGADGGTLSVTNANGGATGHGTRINQSGTYAITNANGGGNGAAGVIATSGYNTGLTIGTATGGSGPNAPGLQLVTGSATIGVAKGGSNATSPGASNQGMSGGILTVNGTDLTGTGYPAVTLGGPLRVASSVKLAFSNISGTLTKYYDPTLMPVTTDVRHAVSYGGTDFLGSAYIPSAGSVLFGVNVDATTGTWILPDNNYVVSTGTGGSGYGVGGVIGGLFSAAQAADVQAGVGAFGPNNTWTATYPTTATTQAAQLATDLAAVGAAQPSILTSVTVLGIPGTATLPDNSHVLNDQTYGVGGSGSTGTLTLPTAAQVESGITCGIAGTSISGTYVGAGFNTDPGISNVRVGTMYEILGSNLTGTLNPSGGGGHAKLLGGE